MLKPILKALAVLLLLFLAAGATFYLQPVWVLEQQIRFRLWRSGVQSRYIQVDGFRIHYLEATPPAGTPDRPLLLIHGLGDRAESFAPLIPTLVAQGFHIYAPDMLGYGRSAQPTDGPYTIPAEENIVDHFLAAVQVPRASVIGWSMGGWIALRLAADHPTLVDRLVLYDAAGVYFPATFAPDLFTPTDAAGLNHLMAMLSPHPRALPAFVARSFLRRLEHYRIPVTRSMASMRDGRSLMDFRLQEIHAPTLVVWGSRDDLLPLATGERIYHGIPNSNLAIVEGCGHLAPSECTRPVLQATLNFLTTNPPPQNTERHLPGTD